MSGSIHPRLEGELGRATRMDDLAHSGLAFDTNPIEFETLDSNIAKGIVKITPGELRRKF